MKKKTKVVVILLSCLLLIGLIAGGVSIAVSLSRRVLTFRGMTIDRGVYAYWTLRYRQEYRRLWGGGQPDTDAFWQSEAQGGGTHADAARAYIDRAIGDTVIAAWLFDEAGGTLTDGQVAQVEARISEATGGDRFGDGTTYEAHAKAWGFTVRDVRIALLYEQKAYRYLTTGTVDDAELDAFVASHDTPVAVLYIGTETRILTDAETGKPLTDDDGAWRTRPLTDEERKKQNETVARIAEILTAGVNSGLSYAEREETFRSLIRSYNENPATLTTGDYWFAAGSSFTSAYAGDYPDVTQAALSLTRPGEWQEVREGDGCWFLFAVEKEAGAWRAEENQPFFTDLTTRYLRARAEETVTDLRGDLRYCADTGALFPIAGAADDLYKLLL